MLSKYLYSKVKTSNTEFISVFLNSEEIAFLKKCHIPFYKKDGRYYVDCEKLKTQFCH